jgi:SAM-dependent methyltransferase
MNSKKALTEVHSKYWVNYPAYLNVANIKRHAFHLDIITKRCGQNLSICDIGGGWGAFSAGAALMGMKSILIDDFGDDGFFDPADIRHKMPEMIGFERISRDVVKEGLDFKSESVDVFTSFDSIEHWHHSPKAVFKEIMRALRPGGLFLIGVPNAVNLRKRLSVPLGVSNWSSIEDWYETPIFRGHIREPVVSDLSYIARDMGLVNVEIIGRNWMGYMSSNSLTRKITPIMDMSLRPFPSLCSDIYLLGRRL